MKFAGLLLVVLCLTADSYCQRWKKTGVENAGREISYNADNITILDIGQHKNIIRAWFKEQFVNQNVSGILYSTGYTLTLYAFDCSEKIWSVDELIFRKPSGEVIRDYTYETEWRQTSPGSPMALLSYFICNKYSPR
ncbi:MAG TPA: hypothetical protein VFI33_02775 [Puia sp.]|nr:hypothetical protein [Puia sp.]